MPIRRSSMIDRTAPLRTALLAPLCLASASPAPARDPQLWVSNEVSNTISVIAPRSNAVTATITVGRRPRGMALSPDGRTVYVALGQDDAVGVIDVAQGKLIRTIPTGRDPELVAVSPDGATLFVSNEEIAHASGVGVQTGRIKFSTQVRVEPEGTAVSPDGPKVYVTAETRNPVRAPDPAPGRRRRQTPCGESHG